MKGKKSLLLHIFNQWVSITLNHLSGNFLIPSWKNIFGFVSKYSFREFSVCPLLLKFLALKKDLNGLQWFKQVKIWRGYVWTIRWSFPSKFFYFCWVFCALWGLTLSCWKITPHLLSKAGRLVCKACFKLCNCWQYMSEVIV